MQQFQCESQSSLELDRQSSGKNFTQSSSSSQDLSLINKQSEAQQSAKSSHKTLRIPKPINLQSNAILIATLHEKSASLHSSVYDSYKNDYIYLNDPNFKGEDEDNDGLENNSVKLKKRKRSFKEGITKCELPSPFTKSSSI